MMFEPLKTSLKGYPDYSQTSILIENDKRGFIVSYEDIIETPKLIENSVALDEGCNEETMQDILITFAVSDSGYTKFAPIKIQQELLKLKELRSPLATFSLAIPSIGIVGTEFSNIKRLEIGRRIIDIITKAKSRSKEESEKSQTSIPNFDIQSTNILNLQQDDELLFEKIKQREDYILSLFGIYKDNVNTTIENLVNESLTPILLAIKYPLEDFKVVDSKNELDEEKEQEPYTQTVFPVSNKGPTTTLTENGIMTIEIKLILQKNILMYIYDLGWNLLYSRSRDGYSYRT